MSYQEFIRNLRTRVLIYIHCIVQSIHVKYKSAAKEN